MVVHLHKAHLPQPLQLRLPSACRIATVGRQTHSVSCKRKNPLVLVVARVTRFVLVGTPATGLQVAGLSVRDHDNLHPGQLEDQESSMFPLLI